EAADGAQVAFAVRMELAADFRERALQPDRAHHVLEALARALVHVRIARGNAWEMHALAERFELGDARSIVRAAQELHRDPGPPRKTTRDPCRFVLDTSTCHRRRRDPQREEAFRAF